MWIVSKTDSRVRIKFEDELEKTNFMRYMKDLPGIKKLKEGKANSVIIEYEPKSAFEFILKNLRETKEEPRFSGDEIYHYVSVVLKNPAAKALWAMLWLGPKRGFLTFAICTMVGRYLKARFS